jgi:streptomycin 6-kinase
VLAIPPVVRRKAVALGATEWLASLPALVEELARSWSLTLGRVYEDGTEALVIEAGDAVLKIAIPGHQVAVHHEITVLRLADGDGCAALLRSDEARGALLVERLGPSLNSLALPVSKRHAILCDTAARVWRPAAGSGLPTGEEKARRLAEYIPIAWEETGRPCSERAVEHALGCAERRRAAHDDERAVLVHGDVHEWNALRSDDGFKLVDPDGLLAEPEYDLGVIMREDPLEGDLPARADWLAQRTGLDRDAIWEWGVVERVSTGLLATRIELQPVGAQMLAVADGLAQVAT